ncbi:JAB domain-containing protein [Oceanivirga miroungae]|uniref:DNA repair protein RadC n=1 Tax=Oceanivirga miroungae TaxID=1130046 RepID=A0A6I8MCV2_9FUSO|nr:JAB domain-containing protein [Oceanivirga miroungae]VWL84961.1 DNA repair protein RadC [Oceanivirga miroungae]
MDKYNLKNEDIEKIISEAKKSLYYKKEDVIQINSSNKFMEYARDKFNPEKDLTIIGVSNDNTPLYIKQYNNDTRSYKRILKDLLNKHANNCFAIYNNKKKLSKLYSVLEVAEINVLDRISFEKVNDKYKCYVEESREYFEIDELDVKKENIEIKSKEYKMSNLLEEIVNRNIEGSYFILDNESIEKNLQLKYQNIDREVFGLIMLDKNNKVIKYTEPFVGTLDKAYVYMREVVKDIINTQGVKNVVMHHNHPSGNLKSSDHDISMTFKVAKALSNLNIGLVDHLIISKNGINKLSKEIDEINFNKIYKSNKENELEEITERNYEIFPRSRNFIDGIVIDKER